MTCIQIGGTNIFYLQEGEGNEIILFSHELFWSHKMFAQQIKHFSKKYTILAYDHRGQGNSESSSGRYDMDLLTQDAMNLIDKVAGRPVNFVGLGMGGVLGIKLASRYPEKIKSLVLMGTSASSEPVENIPKYKLLNGIIRWFGILPALGSEIMKIFFAESWIQNPLNNEAYKFWLKELKTNSKKVHKSIKAVIHRKGVEGELRNITCPTLIIIGDEDMATKPEKAKFIQMAVQKSKLHVLPGTGHNSCIEKPEKVNALITDWLETILGS